MTKLKKKASIKRAEIVIIVVFVLALLLPQLIGTTEKATTQGTILSLDDINGLAFVSMEGDPYDDYIHARFPDSSIEYVTDDEEMAASVVDGKADAFVAEESIIQAILDENNDLTVYPIPLIVDFEKSEEEEFYVVLRSSDCNFPITTKQFSDAQKEGVTVAAQAETDSLYFAEDVLTNAEILSYPSLADIYYAVSTGKIDYGVTYDDNFVPVQENYENLAFIRQPLFSVQYSFAMQKNDKGEAICNEYDAFITKIKENGEYDQILSKWENVNTNENPSGQYTYTGEKGVLKIATSGTWLPMSYYVGTELTGEFVELLCYFCQENGYTPDFYVCPFVSQIAGLVSGEYDVVADSVGVTKERLESTNLTAPLLSSKVMLVTRADENSGAVVSKASVFLSDLKTGIEKNFIREGRWKMLLSGLLVSVTLSLFAGVFGTICGALICGLRLSKFSYATGFARIYIKVIQGTPIVVLLMVLYYLVFGNVDADAYWVCVLGFSLDFSAYAAEIFRSGVESVPEGQKRAAKALGFNRIKTFTKVVLPQAVMRVLPVFCGQFIATVKLTSVAGYISVQDLTKVSDIIRSRTYDAFFPLIATAVIYYLISAALVRVLKVVERKIDPMIRKRKIKGVHLNVD